MQSTFLLFSDMQSTKEIEGSCAMNYTYEVFKRQFFMPRKFNFVIKQ